ncbi:MAG TPA: RNA polymerase sigma factor RpoD, partial [Firmicutes bacterium]|nr:RNA polymerase sigma factor RpoD [Bacillota bacterium]
MNKETSLRDAQEMLMKKGKKRGMLTYKEIMNSLQEFDLSTEEIDEFYEKLT